MIVIVISLCYFYFPLKLAIKGNDYTEKNYIVCEKVKTTGFDWRISSSSVGYVGMVVLKGNIDDAMNFKYPLEWGHNQFIMKGNFSNEEYDFGNEKYPIFIVDSWEIIYPVKRDGFSFLSPSYGIVPADLIGFVEDVRLR